MVEGFVFVLAMVEFDFSCWSTSARIQTDSVVGVVVGGDCSRGRPNVGFADDETMLIGFHHSCNDSSEESLLLLVVAVVEGVMRLRRMRGCFVLRARAVVSAVRVPWLEAAESSSSTKQRFFEGSLKDDSDDVCCLFIFVVGKKASQPTKCADGITRSVETFLCVVEKHRFFLV